jgi:uncharacterized membrane protein
MITFTSDISGVSFPAADKVLAGSIRKSLLAFINKEHPDFDGQKCLSLTELNVFREAYISQYISKQIGELSQLEKSFLDSISEKADITQKLEDEDNQTTTFGQRVADRMALFGGSWRFLISFLMLLVIWIGFNGFFLSSKAFDPYPFILLNLILSCIAALQAPVIMMSQNRQEEKDRERARKDYLINLKSEIEIRNLHEKLDHLIKNQQQELLELQRVQIEMMNDILSRVGSTVTI